MTERERKILMGEDIQPRTADENAYANVSGGGGGIFPVAITVTAIPGEVESYSFSDANHTVNEISEAVAENKLPVLFATEVSEGVAQGTLIMYYARYNEDRGAIQFEALNANGNRIFVHDGNKVDGEFA